MRLESYSLTKFSIGGQPVSFENGHLCLAGEEVTPERWEQLKVRIDTLLRREGLLEPPKEAPRSLGSGRFLLNNLPIINTLKRGKIKQPPFWLKWLYDGVVTKEVLHDDYS